MKAQLLDAGLKEAAFEPGDGRTIEGADHGGDSAARWPPWKIRSSPWNDAASAFAPMPFAKIP